MHSSVSLQSANSFMKFRLQIEIPGPHIMRYYPLFLAARQSVFLLYRTFTAFIFLSLSFSLFTTYGSRILWTLRGYFLNVSCAPCTGSKIEIIGFRYSEVLYITDRTAWIRCASAVLIWATHSGRCTQLRVALASAAPIIIIHAGT